MTTRYSSRAVPLGGEENIFKPRGRMRPVRGRVRRERLKVDRMATRVGKKEIKCSF